MTRNLIVAISMAMALAVVGAGGCGGDPRSPFVEYTSRVKQMIEVEGRYDEAITFLEERSRQFPRAAPTWYWLSIAYFKKGQYEQAVNAMDRAFSSDQPKLAEAWYATAYDFRGWAYFHRGDLQAALADFNRALPIAKDANVRQDALRGRGWIRLRSDQYAQGAADFTAALPLIDRNNHGALVDALEGRAWCGYSSRNYARALSDLNHVWPLIGAGNPAKQKEILWMRGWSKYYLGDFNGAIEDANLALPIETDNDRLNLNDPHRILAFAYLALERDDEALEAIEKARAVPYGLASDQDLAMIYLVMGQRPKAFSVRGGAGWLGLVIEDYNEGGVTGARIASFTGGSAATAGLQAGDVILAIDQQPVTNSKDVSRQVAPLEPGQKIQVDILRNGTRSGHTVTVGSVEEYLAGLPILAPVLKVRPIPPAPVELQTAAVVTAEGQGKTEKTETAGTADEVAPVKAASAVAVENTGADQTPIDKPSLLVKDLKIEPQPVKAGEAFEVTFEVLVEDFSTLEMELELTLVRAIAQDGKSLLEPAPETLTVVNGEPKTIVKKMRASKTAGDYTFEVTLARGEQTARQSVEFRIE